MSAVRIRYRPLPKNRKRFGVVAQFWLEHRPVTPEVASSSLVYPANKTFSLRRSFRFFYRITIFNHVILKPIGLKDPVKILVKTSLDTSFRFIQNDETKSYIWNPNAAFTSMTIPLSISKYLPLRSASKSLVQA